MKKFLTLAGALICAAALTLTSCAEAPGTGGASAPPAESPGATADGAGFKACMVSDSGGFDDKGFNQTSHKGMLDAKAELGIETGEVESQTTADYAKNIQSWGCKLQHDRHLLVLISDDTLAEAQEELDTGSRLSKL